MAATLTLARSSARCALFGHKVHHTKIVPGGLGTSCARCGSRILDRDDSVSRVAHTLSCFFAKHHYLLVASRASHREYVCERCGHPLLFELDQDPYASRCRFEKKVNYVCGLLGHRVHEVAARPEATEYACACGHSFVKAERGITFVRHPLACVVLGHFIKLNEIRNEWVEYVCRRCGHPFCFKLAERASHNRTQEKTLHG